MSKSVQWLTFLLLAIIWGSSFILMKEGMVGLSSVQVASVRITSAGLILLPIAIRYIRSIPKHLLPIIFLSGALGNLFPAYLFCEAEMHVGSALAGTLNSLTPIFVIVTGALFFQLTTTLERITGIIIALSGSVLLFFSQPSASINNNVPGVLMIITATIMYGLNVNIVQRYLKHINALHVTAVTLLANAIPALSILFFTGYFNELHTTTVITSTGFALLLGILGTALATILFYQLIKKAGAVFSSMVTYLIPVVANIWGFIYGEHIGWMQIVSLLVILAGVYIAGRWKRKKHQEIELN